MAFRIKDLMITVLPIGGHTPVQRPCEYPPQSPTCFGGCTRIQCSDYPTYGIREPEDETASELTILRAELAELKALQGYPWQLDPKLNPMLEPPLESVEGLDALEQHLQEALEELHAERDRRMNATNE